MDLTAHDKMPFLVQRIQERYDDAMVVMARGAGKSGIDAEFRFDYMGSAEFEFGALPAALKVMREKTSDVITCELGNALRTIRPNADVILTKIEHNGYKSYYVGPKAGLEVATEFFKHELDTPFPYTGFTHRFKEMTYVRESYGLDSNPSEEQSLNLQKVAEKVGIKPKRSKKNSKPIGYYNKQIGWWAVNNDLIPWALFVTDPDARAWKRAVYGVPAQ